MSNKINIKEACLLIRISRLFREDLTEEELYEATRGVWKLGTRRNDVKYALSVANGEVQEVYQVDTWLPSPTLKYNTRPQEDVEVPGRWEFSGKIAESTIRNNYIGKSVKHYFERGAANPTIYVNC